MIIENKKDIMLKLSEVELTESPVITCTADLSENSFKAIERLELLASSVSRGLGGIQKWSFDEALAGIKNFLLHVNDTSSESVIIYCREGEAPFLYAFPVGVKLETELVVDELPHIYPIVETCDTYHRFVMVTLNSNEARIFETTAGSVTCELLTERPSLRKKIGREWTRERYRSYEEEKNQRFLQNKIDVLNDLMAKGGYKSLIVSGSPKMVGAFKRLLPSNLSNLLLDTLTVNPRAGIDTILCEAIDLFVANEREESRNNVDELESMLMKQGLAVSGESAVNQALHYGYARTLVIDQSYPRDVRERLVRLAIRGEVAIETVEGSETLARLGGVGCLLRYRPTYLDYPCITEAI